MDNKIVKAFFISLLFFPISLFSFSSADSLDCRFVGGKFDETCFAIFVKDNFAYIGDEGNFKIYNVQNPSNPVYRGQVSEPSDVNGIYVVGNYAYVADGADGLRIINVSSPTSPSHIHRHDTDAAMDVYVVDNLAYIADGAGGLRRINISNPNSPYQTGRYSTPGSAFGVYIVDDLAYVADHGAGLQIFNISSPDTLLRIGYLPMGGYADGIHVKDTIAYVASGIPGLRIINVSDPTDPNLIETISTFNYAKDVYVKNNLAYVADRVGGLRIILVLDPTNPTEVGYYDTNADYAEDVFVKDSLAYVAAGNDGFYIIQYTGDAGVEEGLGETTSIINNLSGVKINYYLKDRKRVNISVYNVLGQKITSLVNAVQNTGGYSVKWNGNTGIYFVRMEIGRYTYKEKVIILR